MKQKPYFFKSVGEVNRALSRAGLSTLRRLAVHEACLNALEHGGGVCVLKMRQSVYGLSCAVEQQNPVTRLNRNGGCGWTLIDKICDRKMVLNGKKTLALFFKNGKENG